MKLSCKSSVVQNGYECSSRVTCILHDAWLRTEFYRPMCYNSWAHCSLLQCLHASVILADVHSYFVASSFKWEGKNSCHDLIPTLMPKVCYENFVDRELHSLLKNSFWHSDITVFRHHIWYAIEISPNFKGTLAIFVNVLFSFTIKLF
jgi:hypothetical protein